MTKFSRGFAHLILIIGVVLVGIVGIGYFAIKNGQIKLSPQKDSATQTTTPSLPAEEIDVSNQVPDGDPANWKTYTIENSQLQFDYPGELEVFNYQQSDHETYEFGTMGLFQGNYDLDGYAISIEIYPENNKSVGWNKLENYNKEDCSNNNTMCGDVQDSHTAGIKAKTYHITYTDGLNTRGFGEYYFERDQTLFVITVLSSTPKRTTNNYPISKILNTFKFLNQAGEELVRFEDKKFGLSFLHPKLWQVQSTFEGGGDGADIFPTISFGLDRYFFGNIIMENNPNNLSPKEWFELKKGKQYSNLIEEMASFYVDGQQAVAYAQADTCQTAPMYVVLVQRGDQIYEIGYFENVSRSRAKDLETILETLKFAGSDEGVVNNIPELFFPEPPDNLDCE